MIFKFFEYQLCSHLYNHFMFNSECHFMRPIILSCHLVDEDTQEERDMSH